MKISATAVKLAADIIAEEMLRDADIESVNMYLARRAARRILERAERDRADNTAAAIARGDLAVDHGVMYDTDSQEESAT